MGSLFSFKAFLPIQLYQGDGLVNVSVRWLFIRKKGQLWDGSAKTNCEKWEAVSKVIFTVTMS